MIWKMVINFILFLLNIYPHIYKHNDIKDILERQTQPAIFGLSKAFIRQAVRLFL